MQAPGEVLKADKWWNDKGSPVLGLAYYLLATSAEPVAPGRVLVAMSAFICAFVGVAGFGYVMNDLGDLELDRAAGKRNTMLGRSGIQIAGILVGLLALSWLPWLFLPANRWNLSLIGFQLLILTLYALPPFRFKVRPLPGVITDTLYAYPIPMLITWTTWSQLGAEPGPRYFTFAALVAWSLAAGVKGILVHQAADAKEDAAAGVRTFATEYGHERTFWLLSKLVVPAEVVFFLTLNVAFSLELRFCLPGLVVFALWRSFQLSCIWGRPVRMPWNQTGEENVRLYGYEFLGEFYTAWFPVFMLAALCWRSPVYLVLAAVHLALFRTGVMEFVMRDLKTIPWGVSQLMRHRG